METLSTKVHAGTVEEIENYREEEGIESRSEAIRRLIRTGLDGNRSSGTDAAVFGTSTAGAVVALMAVGGSLPAYLGVVGAVLWVAGTAYPRLK
jgi:hypothetical protein